MFVDKGDNEEEDVEEEERILSGKEEAVPVVHCVPFIDMWHVLVCQMPSEGERNKHILYLVHVASVNRMFCGCWHDD